MASAQSSVDRFYTPESSRTATPFAPLAPQERDEDNIVDFGEGDTDDPRNWPEWRKWLTVASLLPAELSTSFASAGLSPAATSLVNEFGVSRYVGTLGVSIFVAGFAVGPLFLAPLSEWSGRRGVFLIGQLIHTLFLIGTALAPNVGGFLVMRFLAACNIAITADLWKPTDTAPAQSIFVSANVIGPALGYALMSYVASSANWRTVSWWLSGISGFALVWMFCLLRETRRSIILEKKCKKERERTGNEKLEVPAEARRKGWQTLYEAALVRPFVMEVKEPVVLAFSFITALYYGIQYLFTAAFPLVFGENGGREFTVAQIGSTFLGQVVGGLLGPPTHLLQERAFRKETIANGGILVPERRLGMAMAGGVLFPVCLFWFAWTSLPAVHWIAPVMASVVFGWSFFTLQLMVKEYLTDAYGEYAGSALAAAGFVRCCAGAGFPLFGRQMYLYLSYPWASSLLGFLALFVVPIPPLLRVYGKKMRMRSPWARESMEKLGELDEKREGREESGRGGGGEGA
ncbi:hypothetical protein JCM8097_001503 [Rhodosporidiobolus ruineniae]